MVKRFFLSNPRFWFESLVSENRLNSSVFYIEWFISHWDLATNILHRSFTSHYSRWYSCTVHDPGYRPSLHCPFSKASSWPPSRWHSDDQGRSNGTPSAGSFVLGRWQRWIHSCSCGELRCRGEKGQVETFILFLKASKEKDHGSLALSIFWLHCNIQAALSSIGSRLTGSRELILLSFILLVYVLLRP